MNRTSIGWCDFSANPLKFRDADGNIVWGCVHASPGCQRCYAETLAKRYRRGGPFNVPTTQKLTPFLDEHELHRMLTYKPASRKRVFVGDMTDVFGEWVEDDLLSRLLAVMAVRRDVTFQLLTKRADRLHRFMTNERTPFHVDMEAHDWQQDIVIEWPLPNVWIGVSCEDQPRADERIPLLRNTPAAVRFVSCEPLLGRIDLLDACYCDLPYRARANTRPNDMRVLDWVIVGGESGQGARRCNRRWVQDLVEQCRQAKVPVFVKQLGSVVIDRNDAGFMGDEPDQWPEEIAERDAVEHDLDGTRDGYQGAPVRVHLKNRKGADWNEWPEDLRVRQFPTAVPA